MTGKADAHVGVDVGATLAKIARRVPDTERADFQLLPAHDLPAIAETVARLAPATLGLTGAGAGPLSDQLRTRSVGTPRRFDEFEAWGGGARRLLARSHPELPDSYLLVSLGTGTSMLHVEGPRIERVAGTALGGGTVVGLAAGMIGPTDFTELCRLARHGIERRDQVDLMVGDIYRPGEIALPAGLNAASFAKLARPGEPDAPPASREAVAAACMALVGENVGWIAGWRASSLGTETIVFAGSTLRDNPVLEAVLLAVAAGAGRRGHVLREGEFAGALGALELAA